MLLIQHLQLHQKFSPKVCIVRKLLQYLTTIWLHGWPNFTKSMHTIIWSCLFVMLPVSVYLFICYADYMCVCLPCCPYICMCVCSSVMLSVLTMYVTVCHKWWLTCVCTYVCLLCQLSVFLCYAVHPSAPVNASANVLLFVYLSVNLLCCLSMSIVYLFLCLFVPEHQYGSS